MKIIARILLILVAAGAIIGVAIGLAGTAGAAGPRREASAQVQSGGANAVSGGEQRRDGGPGGEHGDGRAPSLFGAGELLKDLVIIALIVAVTAPLARLLNRRTQSAPASRPSAEPPAIAPPM